jgi:hypothetical protein
MSDSGELPMTDTLLEFAQPLIALTDEGTTPEQLKELLDLLVAIWNAISVDAWGQGTNHVVELEAAMAGEGAPAELSTLFFEFSRRKRELFADDLRAVSNLQVESNGEGGFVVRAEARLPSHLST